MYCGLVCCATTLFEDGDAINERIKLFGPRTSDLGPWTNNSCGPQAFGPWTNNSSGPTIQADWSLFHIPLSLEGHQNSWNWVLPMLVLVLLSDLAEDVPLLI